MFEDFNENYRNLYSYPLFRYPQKERDKMTLIMGFYAKEAVILASDSRGVLSGGTINNLRKKVFKINKYVGVALTGDAQKNYSILQDFEYQLDIIKTKEPNMKDKIIFKQALRNAFINYLRVSTLAGANFSTPTFASDIILGGYLDGDFVIYTVGYDPHQGYHDHFYDKDKDEYTNFVISGTSELIVTVRRYFEDRYKEKMTVEEATPIIEEGIYHFSENNYQVGGNSQIAKITADGFTWIKEFKRPDSTHVI